MEKFRLIRSKSASASYNMWLDREIFERYYQDNVPVLRVYRWEKPSFTYGVSGQPAEELDLPGCISDGGVMILLAECRDGAGNPTFFNWFQHRNLDEFESALRSNYEINGQTAYSLLQKAQRFRILLVSFYMHRSHWQSV